MWRQSPYRAEKLLVQLAFADWANLDGEFYPTYREIAEKARITKPGAIGIVQAMIDEKEIELLSHGGSGRGSRNRYRFAEKYRAAVRELTQQWALKRGKRVKRDDPLRVNEENSSTPERVNEDDPLRVKQDDPSETKRVNKDNPRRVNDDDPLEPKRVNENSEKGKRERAHVRNNPSCIPSEEKPSEELPSKEKPNLRSTAVPVSVSDVFGYWKEALNHPRSILDAQRQRCIRARLDEGFSVEDLKTAIDGCARSPFHMGQNDRNQVYDDITLICRDAKHVEDFIAKADGNSLAAFSPAARQTIAAAESWLKRAQEGGEL